MDLDFTFSEPLWAYPGKSAWFFVTVPKDVAEQIKFFQGKHTGFGSVEVKVYVGNSAWKTSLFPDKKSGSYLLPVKSEIRKAENLQSRDVINLRLVVLT